MTIKPYIMVEYDLLKADGFVSRKTGKYVKLVANDKLLYSYVKARLRFFVEEKKGEYFDTQQSIADALSMNLSSAKTSLAKFRDNEVLFAKKEKFKNYENWRYRKLEELTLCHKKGEDGFELITPVFVEEKKTIGPSKPIYQPAWVDDEEGLPF